MTDPRDLYEELLGPEPEDNDKNFERVSNHLIEMVILAANNLAEFVNGQEAPEQIRFLLESGYSAEEIKEYVGKTSF